MPLFMPFSSYSHCFWFQLTKLVLFNSCPSSNFPSSSLCQHYFKNIIPLCNTCSTLQFICMLSPLLVSKDHTLFSIISQHLPDSLWYSEHSETTHWLNWSLTEPSLHPSHWVLYLDSGKTDLSPETHSGPPQAMPLTTGQAIYGNKRIYPSTSPSRWHCSHQELWNFLPKYL